MHVYEAYSVIYRRLGRTMSTLRVYSEIFTNVKTSKMAEKRTPL